MPPFVSLRGMSRGTEPGFLGVAHRPFTPGGPGNEAGQVNRAYRVMARRIFGTIVPPREDLPGVVSWALRQAARRRFIEARLPGPVIEALLDAGPALGDAWPAYLALAPPSVIRDLLEPELPDPG